MEEKENQGQLELEKDQVGVGLGFSEWRGPITGLDEVEVEGWENLGLDAWCGLRITRRLM